MATVLLVFFAGFLIDVLYVFWMLRVTRAEKLMAGVYSVGLAVPALLGYQEFMKDNWMILPYCLGLFCGTIAGLTLDQRIKNRGNET
ncbi:MAG: hypothetical protein ACXABY_29285 [Candidatus Thorarchaeota archaeon]|jgi:hypothetical protein